MDRAACRLQSMGLQESGMTGSDLAITHAKEVLGQGDEIEKERREVRKEGKKKGGMRKGRRERGRGREEGRKEGEKKGKEEKGKKFQNG